MATYGGGYPGDPRGRERAISDRQGADRDVKSQVDSFRHFGGYDKGPSQQRTSDKIDIGKLFQQSPIPTVQKTVVPANQPFRPSVTPIGSGSSPSQNYGDYSPNLSGIVTGAQNENTLRKQSESVKKSRTDKIDAMVNKGWNKALSAASRYVGLNPYEVQEHLTKPAAGNVTLDLPWDASFQQRADQSSNKALDFYGKTNTSNKFSSGNPFQGLEAIAQLLGIGFAGTAHQGIQGIQNIINQTTPGSYPNFADWWGNMVGLKKGLLGQPPIEQGN